jgi:hypothetical protein
VEEAFDAAEAHAVGRGEGGGGGAVAVASDQFGDVAFVEAVAQAPRRLARGLGVRTGLVSATVWQSCRSVACVECE